MSPKTKTVIINLKQGWFKTPLRPVFIYDYLKIKDYQPKIHQWNSFMNFL